MRCRLHLASAAVVVGMAAAALAVARPRLVWPRTPATPAHPNVLLISTDTTRADHLACYGYSRPTSPYLDGLAARGVRFANARSQAPWTLPSHMSLFTSLLPSHCRMDEPICTLSPTIPTLAELLQRHGYHTAGLVNDGYMQSFFGYARGFADWQEFRAGTPAGKGDHLTDQALEWLGQAPPEPFFLFLHYYDVHGPYESTPDHRRRFGTAATGPQTLTLIDRYRHGPVGNRDQLDQLVAAYDSAIAFLDEQLGRLFARLPANTLVVVCSDHGEEFKEHGDMGHGGHLYDEVLRVPLIMSLPGVLPEGRVVEDPAMLLDVAPTVLRLCGVPAPEHYEGLDLAPTWAGTALPERPILAETFGRDRILKAVALGDWKLIRSAFDAREELYHLPDEHTELSAKEGNVREALSAVARRWLDEEDFWMLYARGPGEYQVSVVPQAGQLLHVISLQGHGAESHCEHGPAGKSLLWVCRPGARTFGLFLQNASAGAHLRLDVLVDGRRRPAQVFAGPGKTHPARLPVDLDLVGADSDPVIAQPFHADEPGVYLFHHRPRRVSPFAPALGAVPDGGMIEHLKSLGYLR